MNQPVADTCVLEPHFVNSIYSVIMMCDFKSVEPWNNMVVVVVVVMLSSLG